MKKFSLIQFSLLVYLSTLDNNLANTNIDDIAESLKVSHYDCKRMTQNKMYALNKVAPCKIAPENTRRSFANVILYQRLFRSEINATMCRVSHNRLKWHCGHHDHSSMDAKTNTITSYLELTARDCEIAAKTNTLTLTQHQSVELPIHKNKKTVTYKNRGDVSSSNRNECDGKDWITHDTYETYMQDITLKVNLKDGSVLSPFSLTLPCTLSEGGCEITSLDRHAYTWHEPENCVFTRLGTYMTEMIKNEDSYYFKGEHSKDDKNNNFFVQVFNEPQTLCKYPHLVYPTPYDALFLSYKGGFDMDTGETKLKSEDEYDVDIVSIGKNQPKGTIGNYEIDYETHLGTKLDYLYFRGLDSLKSTEFTLIKQQGELDRTNLLQSLVMAMENSRLAGFLLTGNRSMFLETNGNVAWLYNCPKFFSPLQVLDKCYDKIPIFYEGSLHFVDPITRQFFKSANDHPCENQKANIFQLDMDDDNSWYLLSPQPSVFKSPSVFKPIEIKRTTNAYKMTSSARAGMYTQRQLDQFWDSIVINSASKDALQKITRELVNPSGYTGTTIYSPEFGQRRLYLDSFISSNYFYDQFIDEFGVVGYWLERLGVWFAVFLFLKLVIDTIITIIKALEIHKLTGASVNFGKLLLSATYNLFFLSIFTSVFTRNSEGLNLRESITEHHLDDRERCDTPPCAVYDTLHARAYPDLEHENTQNSSVTFSSTSPTAPI